MSQSDQLLKHFELARRDLLELTTANRLLSTQRNQAQGACIEIQDESAAEVFRMLVREGRVLRFEEGELIDEPDATLKTEKKTCHKETSSKNSSSIR